MGRRIVLGLVVAVAAAACAGLIVVMLTQGLDRAGAWAGPLAALAGIVAAVAAVWVLAPRKTVVPLPPQEEIPDGAVSRPAELTAVVQALVGAKTRTVGITTGLIGAGGFGKTTLAKMVCADRRVRRRFRGRVYWVQVGQDVRSPARIAAKVNEVIQFVFDKDASFTDPGLAGARLGGMLNPRPRRLLVLDDVWKQEQLAPFTKGGKRCTRLVTTRVPELLEGQGTAVQVDQMSPEQARALLTSGLPPLDPAVVNGLLKVTGQWPLLLRLISKILVNYAQVDASAVSAQAEELLQRLTAGGPAAIEEYLGEGGRGLDVSQPGDRERAVRATIEASTSLLEDQDAERFAELAVFARDKIIPFRLVALLWQATAELDRLQAGQVSHRLAQLALVSRASGPAGGIALHDVIRDFLRAELGRQRLAGLGALLLDKIAADVPAPSPPSPAAEGPVQTAWWDLDDQDHYLWNHLIEHMVDAGRPGDADAVACDLRWVEARLERFGPAAPAADLAAAGTPRAARLRGVFTRTAHLLAPTEPVGAVVDILHSRVADDPDWGPQVTALGASLHRPRLVNRWPLPDPADPALRRVLTGHTEAVSAVAVAPDGSWLASSGDDGTVRIWDAVTGQERAVLTGHFGIVTAVAVAPDGSWLASGGRDKTVRIWDAATGRERAVLVGDIGIVTAVAVAPDGTWLASGSQDNTLRIWEVPTGRQRTVHERAVLKGHTREVATVAVAPDGTWLASGSQDGTVRIWDAATGQERAALTGHTEAVAAVAVAPDSTWLASGDRDGTVRIWDAATGQERAAPTRATSRPAARAVAVAPDGTWLASGSQDGTVRIWDAATGQERAALTGHRSAVAAVAVAPDGTWLASGDRGGTVRIWDAATGQERAAPTRATSRPAARAVAVAPDGTWLASGSQDGTVRIWDAATGQERAALTGHTEAVAAVAVAPDGTWLASGSQDERVRIWDAASGRESAALTGHTGAVTAVAVAPDGTWLASGSQDGTARTWDTATGDKRAALTGHTGAVTAVAVAPDGTWLASGSQDGTVLIWDAAGGRERAALTGHTEAVAAVTVAPDGTWLASGSQDGTVRIWDAATGQKRAALTGQTGAVTAVAVAPDGTWLASGSQDGTVLIWETATWSVCAMMRVDNDIRACAWLSPDTLVLGGSAGLYQFGFLAMTSPATAGQRAFPSSLCFADLQALASSPARHDVV